MVLLRESLLVSALVVLCSLFLSCSEPNDGPMSAWDSGQQYPGTGFYLHASLDSGRRVHSLQDTLPVQLDSMWIISSCALRDIQLQSQTQGDEFRIHLQLNLLSNGDVNCPVSPLQLDSLVKIGPQSAWSNGGRLIIMGALESAVINSDTTRIPYLQDAYRYSVPKDSIWLMNGANVDTAYTFLFDSLFNDPSQPKRLTGAGPWVTQYLRNTQVVVDTLRLTPQTCLRPRSTCKLEPDTIWSTSYLKGEVNLVPVRMRCVGDSTHIEYCAITHWKTDSLAQTLDQDKTDTIWTMESYYLERISNCSVLNRDSLTEYSLGAKGGSMRIWRELFIPAADKNEGRCGIPWVFQKDSTAADPHPTPVTLEARGSVLEYWLTYDILRRRPVLDTLLIDSIFQSIGFDPQPK